MRFAAEARKILQNAIEAPAWQRQGNKFEPTMHLVGGKPDLKWTLNILREHAESVVAYSVGDNPVISFFSIELQFRSAEAMRECRKLVNKGRRKRTPQVQGNPPLHQRLQTGCMYVLPDGREFLLMGKWDEGSRWGKVIVANHGDNLILANQFVPDDVLRRCPVVPKDEQMWA